MNFTNELKEKLANAGSEQKVSEILEETKRGVEAAGVILDDEDIENVSGGVRVPSDYNPQRDEFDRRKQR